MPLARLIPCLDVAYGRVVKGVSFGGLFGSAQLSDVGPHAQDLADLAVLIEQRALDQLQPADLARRGGQLRFGKELFTGGAYHFQVFVAEIFRYAGIRNELLGGLPDQIFDTPAMRFGESPVDE